MLAQAQHILGLITRRSDVLLALSVVMILFMIIVPLPTILLDALIAVNMTAGMILLMVAVYIPSPLAFSVFPAILLITTLFRLALNISSTRLILLDADAGQIIFAFGEFVVGDNFVVGAVLFLIITIVQFVLCEYIRGSLKLRKLIEMELYEVPVLSYQELTQEITVQPLDRIVCEWLRTLDDPGSG